MQVRTLSSTKKSYPVEPAVIEKNAMIGQFAASASASLVWPALLRKLDRLKSNYAT
jgi:hypothetical protein